MDEINSLEKMVHSYVQQAEEIGSRNEELQDEIDTVKKENELLKFKIKELEEKVGEIAMHGNTLFEGSSANQEEREKLKNKINELISKLEYHLRS